MVSGIIAQPTDNKELISTGGQYAFGIPFGDNVGIDLTLGILPVDLKVAVPITAGNFVLYPFCSVFFRDTILLPRRRWHYDPGLELAFLATPDFAFKATAWTMRYETFEGLGTESKPFGLRTDFVSLSLEPIHSGPGMTLLSHLTLGYGYGGDHQSMVFFKLGLGAMTSPALYR